MILSKYKFRNNLRLLNETKKGYKKIDNNLFSYNVDGQYIYLHMIHYLKKLIYIYGASKVRKILNLQLLVAIEKITKLIDQGNTELKGKKYLYMLSPLLFGETELNFLKELGFETKSFKRGDLRDKTFVNNDDDARLAVFSFGENLNVGKAQISIDQIKSPEFITKIKAIIEQYKQMGIPLSEEELVNSMIQGNHSVEVMEELI